MPQFYPILFLKKKPSFYGSQQKETYPRKKRLLWAYDEIHEDIDGSKWDKRAAIESLVQGSQSASHPKIQI